MHDPTSDRWATLFALQSDLAAFYREMRPDGFYAQDPITRCTTWTRALIHEACEIDVDLNWKPWKEPTDLTASREHRLEETADILHFLLQLTIDQGFSADELFAAYARKNAENRRRQLSDPRYQPHEPEARERTPEQGE